MPAVVIQHCMLPYYGLPEVKDGASQIARGKYESPKLPNAYTGLIIFFRRVKGEVKKGLIKLMTMLGHERIFISYFEKNRQK